jgi:hypothetical protein
MLEVVFLQIEHKSNLAFYGKEGVTREDIFTHRAIKMPAPAEEFKQLLAKYTTVAAKE